MQARWSERLRQSERESERFLCAAECTLKPLNARRRFATVADTLRNSVFQSRSMKLKLSKFDMSSVKPGTIQLFQGRRNTGKSSLLRSAMWAMREHIELTIAMTTTQSSADMFRTLMPTSCVYDQGST